MTFPHLHRRELLASGSLFAAGTVLSPSMAGAAGVPSAAIGDAIRGPYLDLTTPKGNMLAFARLQGDLDPTKTKYLWFSGNVMGVRPDQKTRDLFKIEGMSCCRLEELPEGGYMRILREVGFYTDPKTGEVMDEWKNVYTGETVEVVHILNDPFNYKIEEQYPEPPSFGGQNEEKPPRIPFILPWIQYGENLNVDIHIHLRYPSPLKPDKWPRESHGRMTTVSEIFMNQVKAEEMQDEKLTSLPHTGTWTRMTPWLPWMLMDQAEGHCVYSCFKGTGSSLDVIPKHIRDYTERNYPKFMTAPETYEEPSLSSLENYAREQTPAPK